jgi:sialate O-acetylesterase
MEMGLAAASPEEAKAADHPNIRLFIVQQRAAYAPVATPKGEWKVCTPKSVAEGGWGGFSAVGYFFGSTLHKELNVPIGLVEDAVGGTPAEAWTSAASLKKLGGFDPQLAEVDRLHQRGGPEYGNFVMHWYDEYDPGIKGQTWAAPTFDDSSWKTVTIPGGFAELGVPQTPAVCWFRKEVTLPDPLPTGPARILLGQIERMDTTTINGKFVGASAWSENPRNYPVPAGVLKPGRNVITVRVFKTKPDGGFMSPPDALRLELDDKTTIPLAGQWKGALAVDAKPPHSMPLGFENWPTMPSVLYNGMLTPAAPLALTGAIWYQGEANVGRAKQYQALLPTMIADWRAVFGQGDFPFYIVQIPSFTKHKDQPGDGAWADFREAQAVVARTVPNAGLAVTIDTGDPDDIHPKDKGPVGERLAKVALANHYKKEGVIASGPTFARVEQAPGGALRVHFDHTDGGLVARGGTPEEFSIAGPDHKWHWATAKIDGNSVLVSSPEVPNPVAVRYAWQGTPKATLFNGAGLPAMPFRTDN